MLSLTHTGSQASYIAAHAEGGRPAGGTRANCGDHAMTMRIFIAAASAAAVLAACERSEEQQYVAGDITITVHGDSVIEMPEPAGENAAVECSAFFRATVEGPEGGAAVMRSGRVQYWWWTTGVEAGAYEFTSADLLRLWVDTIFPAGQDRRSYEHAFAQAPPKQPVRAEITFDYAPAGAAGTKTTEPYRFYCY
jgi:hypothetical protein